MLSDPLNETRREFVSALIPSMLSTSAHRAHITIRLYRNEERNHPWWWHNTKIQCLFARAQYLLVWVERQIYFVMFSLVENGAKDNTKVNPLQALCVFKVTHSISFGRNSLFFFFYFFRMDRENKLRERKENNKKTKRKLNMANRLGCGKQPIPCPPDKITHHFQHFPPGSDHARRENWIFRLSKPHKPVAGVSRTFLVAFFVQKWALILLSNLTFHSTCKKGPEYVWETLSCGTGLLMPTTIVQVGVKRVDDQNA